ncbi:CinA family protein [Rhodococcus sp. NPDC054953]
MRHRPPPHAAHTTEVCSRLAEAALARGLTVGCAESLTSGRVAAALGAAPDAASWFRGGIVAYAREVKHGLLRVPAGPVVCAEAARMMADSAAALLGADITVAVTGVGGPSEQDGRPVGTVWFAVAGAGRTTVEERHFDGDPARVVEATVARAVDLLTARVVDPAR